ncbi:MAG: dethiobiotin synthase [Verrucomicrobia bacterium]|nr:dethiobiotin synthase [Verrucomicrobiota bacterium]
MGPKPGIVFVTGTDTGVGKTIVTALLLRQLRAEGVEALAMKPFASGSREDADWYRAVQGKRLPARLLVPFFFRLPLAPWVASRRERRRVSLGVARARVQAARARCELLLVEGAGGLLTPLGAGFTLLDLVRELHGAAVVVGPNRLGVLNQMLLATHALRTSVRRLRAALVLVEQAVPDLAAASNAEALVSWLRRRPMPVYRIERFEDLAGGLPGVEALGAQTRTTLPALSAWARRAGQGDEG